MQFLTRSRHMGAAAVIMGSSVLLSRFMGLIRDKVISYYYGAGAEADLYFAAFVIPDFINYLLAGGYFSITLIPLLSRRFAESRDLGWNFFSAVFWWVTAASAALVYLAWLLAPDLTAFFFPDFDPASRARLVYFLRIILPAQVFFLPGATLTALLYLRRQFTVPALTPLIYNAWIIAGGLILHVLAPERGMEGFCWGVFAGALCGSFLLPLITVWQGDFSLRLAFRKVGLSRFFVLALPLMLGQSIVGLDEQFTRIFGAMTGEGNISLLSYARRLMFVPIGVVAQAAGVASYPFLAALAAEGAFERFAATLNTAAKNALALVVPLCVWMAAASLPLVRLIFQQGRFSAAETASTAVLLSLMLSAVLFWTIQQMLSRAFYALEDTLTPALAGSLITMLSLPVYWFAARLLGAPGVALSGVLAIILYTLLLAYLWQKRRGSAALRGFASLIAKALAVSALPGFAALGAALYVPQYSGCEASAPLCSAFLALAVSGTAFALLYIPAALRIPELGAPLVLFLDKLRRKRAL